MSARIASVLSAFFTLSFFSFPLVAQWQQVIGAGMGYYISQEKVMTSMCVPVSPSSGSSCTIRFSDDTGSTWTNVGGGQGVAYLVLGTTGLRKDGVFFTFTNFIPNGGFRQYTPGVGWKFIGQNFAGAVFALDTMNIFRAQSYNSSTYLYRYIDQVSLETVVVPDEGFRHIYFLDAGLGYAISRLANDPSERILRTSDSGETWDLLWVNDTISLNAMWFATDQVGYCIGDSGVIFKHRMVVRIG